MNLETHKKIDMEVKVMWNEYRKHSQKASNRCSEIK